MKKSLVYVMVLLIILSFNSSIFALPGYFKTLGGSLNVGQDKDFDIRLAVNAGLDLKDNMDIRLCTDDIVNNSLTIKGYDVQKYNDKTFLKLHVRASSVGNYLIDTINLNGEISPIGALYLNVRGQFEQYSFKPFETGTTIYKPTPKMSVANYGLNENLVEIKFVLSLNEDWYLGKFVGVKPIAASETYYTMLDVFDEKGNLVNNFKFNGYQTQFNMSIKKNNSVHVKYVMKDRYDNYVLQPEIGINNNLPQYMGYVVFI